MNEEFLHYIWQFKIYSINAQLADGTAFEVIHCGTKNTDAGPDFFNAKVKIADTLWAGNVEIHVNSSDWYKHNHHQDPKYDNTILHVVWNNDKNAVRHNGTAIPTFELQDYVEGKAVHAYNNLMNATTWIPCEKNISEVNKTKIALWLERLCIERLEDKTDVFKDSLNQNNNDWNAVFYQMLAANMGMKVNRLAFEMLAKSLPYKYLLLHADQLFQLEALLFGQAGLLNEDLKDEYPKNLFKEYLFLQKKYSLKPIQSKLWRNMRLHPSNFPTIRIAQLAAIIFEAKANASIVLNATNTKDLFPIFSVSASEYWNTHYQFDKKSSFKEKKLGKFAIDLLIINFVAPFLMQYHKQKQNEDKFELPLKILNEIKSENNNIIRNWKSIGIKAQNAAQSQALIQLKNVYCNNKKCLSCAIGKEIIT